MALAVLTAAVVLQAIHRAVTRALHSLPGLLQKRGSAGRHSWLSPLWRDVSSDQPIDHTTLWSLQSGCCEHTLTTGQELPQQHPAAMLRTPCHDRTDATDSDLILLHPVSHQPASSSCKPTLLNQHHDFKGLIYPTSFLGEYSLLSASFVQQSDYRLFQERQHHLPAHCRQRGPRAASPTCTPWLVFPPAPQGIAAACHVMHFGAGLSTNAICCTSPAGHTGPGGDWKPLQTQNTQPTTRSSQSPPSSPLTMRGCKAQAREGWRYQLLIQGFG